MSPVLCRYAYSLPSPPSAEVLTAARGVLQSVLLLAANALVDSRKDMPAPTSNGSPFSSWGEGGSKEQLGPGTAAPATPLSPAWLLALPPVMLGSLEIGLYNTTGTTAQAWGLEVGQGYVLRPCPGMYSVLGGHSHGPPPQGGRHMCACWSQTAPPAPPCRPAQVTGATRSAFLIQASALFTPMLAAVGGQRLTTNAWLGSALGLAGTLAVVGDTTQGGAGFGAGVSGAASGLSMAGLVWVRKRRASRDAFDGFQTFPRASRLDSCMRKLMDLPMITF